MWKVALLSKKTCLRNSLKIKATVLALLEKWEKLLTYLRKTCQKNFLEIKKVAFKQSL